jgi:hypothetical protein
MVDSERRRRRLRRGHPEASDAAGPPADIAAPPLPDGRTAETARVQDPVPEQSVSRRPPAGAAAEDRDGERGLRSLVGSGTSQVGVSAALRARDAARPTDADLADAEDGLVLVRRNWVPREDLPRPPR